MKKIESESTNTCSLCFRPFVYVYCVCVCVCVSLLYMYAIPFLLLDKHQPLLPFFFSFFRKANSTHFTLKASKSFFSSFFSKLYLYLFWPLFVYSLFLHSLFPLSFEPLTRELIRGNQSAFLIDQSFHNFVLSFKSIACHVFAW